MSKADVAYFHAAYEEIMNGFGGALYHGHPFDCMGILFNLCPWCLISSFDVTDDGHPIIVQIRLRIDVILDGVGEGRYDLTEEDAVWTWVEGPIRDKVIRQGIIETSILFTDENWHKAGVPCVHRLGTEALETGELDRSVFNASSTVCRPRFHL